jgi:RND family efflux transporter MFP subunit
MRVRVIVVGVLIIALGGGFLAVRARGTASSAASQVVRPAPQTPVPVTVATARHLDVVTSVSAIGTVASLREAKIASKLSGIIAEVFVKEGQRVQTGTPLMRLRTSELAATEAQARASVATTRARLAQLLNGARPEERRQAAAAVAQAQAAVQAAQANLAQTRAALDLAQANVQRMRTLYETGAVSRQDLDAAESQFRQAQAASMASESQLGQTKAAEEAARQSQQLVDLGARSEEIAAARAQLAQAEAALASAQIQLRDATVTAPFAGTITERSVEPGEAVSPAVPSFVLAQLDDVYAELAVPERQRPGLHVGQTVAVTVDALPGSQFVGKIEEVEPVESVSNRAFTVKVRVPNSQGVLRPGMFARGMITVSVRPDVLQVPDTAVLVTSGKPIVFIVEDGKAVRREVTLGERQNNMVEITSGLSGGDQVAVSGAAALTDNQPVACSAPRVTVVACR